MPANDPPVFGAPPPAAAGDPDEDDASWPVLSPEFWGPVSEDDWLSPPDENDDDDPPADPDSEAEIPRARELRSSDRIPAVLSGAPTGDGGGATLRPADRDPCHELLSRVTPYRGPVFTIQVDRLRRPLDGRTIQRDTVVHPGAVAVLPIIADRVLFVRQYRHALGGMLLEIPAGLLDPGEAPEHAAARELEEETGYCPGELERLCEFVPAPGMSDERITIFRATGLVDGDLAPDDDEHVEVVEVTLEDAFAAIDHGLVSDAKTLIALLLERRRVEG